MTGLPPDVFLPLDGDSVRAEGSRNRVIEGDNLAVLTALQDSMTAGFKLVYIDPPYNTGRLFTYRDHCSTDWVEMMRPRVEAARSLLRDDGAIVVHIDEHEHARLVLLLDEVFGSAQRLGTIVWDKLNPKGDATGIANQHEYILCWAKDRSVFAKAHPLLREKPNATRMLAKATALMTKVQTGDDLAQANRAFREWIRGQADLNGGEAAYNRIDADGQVFQAVSMAWPNKRRAPDAYFAPLQHPITSKPCPVPARGWRNPPDTMEKLLTAGRIVFGADHTTQPRRKYLLAENTSERIPSVLRDGSCDDDLLARLGTPFDHAKPLSIARRIVRWFTRDPGDWVLDCFAGSGTVGHAVLAENAERGAALGFVLIQAATPVIAESAAAAAGYSDIAQLTRARLTACIAEMDASAPRGADEDRGFGAERWSGRR
jgi:adenine-specific DNA-methyltransferase